MKVFGLARIGRDVEIRTLTNGDAVAGLALAFNYRNKGEKCTQWVEASLWGRRAEVLAPYLRKGGLVSVTIDDVHIETYQGRDKEGVKLVGRVADVELAGGGGDRPEVPAPQRTQAAKPANTGGFEDMSDDIPFANPMRGSARCLAM